MRIHFWLFVLLTGIWVSQGQAKESWDFSGFATLGAGKTNRDDLKYMDYDEDWSFDSDTVLGLQIVWEPVDRLSLTGQVVTRGFSFSDSADYEAETEWLFLSYDLFDNGRMRVGRMRTPYQYYSESIEVGYSYVWVRPPVDAYAFIFEPFTHFDGVDYTFTFNNKNSDAEVKLLYGRQKGNYLESEAQIEQLFGFSFVNRWENFTLRYAFLDHTVDLETPQYDTLIAGLEAAIPFDPGFADLATQYTLENGRMRYHSLAGDWRLGNWNLIVERYELEPPDKELNNRSRGWYLSIARQFNEFTPYFVVGAYTSAMGKEMYDLVDDVYSRVEPLYPQIMLDPNLTQEQAAAIVAGLQSLKLGAIQGIDGQVGGQRSYTIGARYDLRPRIAIKGEIQYIEFTRGSTGLFVPKVWQQNRRADPNDAMSITFVVDVVF